MAKVFSYQNGMSNAYFVIDKAVIAVDTGSAEDEAAFLSACKACGIQPTDIQLIVITHGHCDHFQNLNVMKRLTNAPALCHKNAEIFLKEGLWPNKIGRTWIGQDILDIEAVEGVDMDYVAKVEPDILLDGEYDLHSLGVGAKILPVHGHSEGDLVVLTDDGDAIVGDLYAEGPGYGKSGPAFFMGPGDTFLDAVVSVERLLKQGAHTFWSGHGGPFSRGEVVKNTAQDRAEGFTAGQPPKGQLYSQKFPNLCMPLQVGKITLRNRMCAAPVGFPDLTEDGCLTEGAIAFYERRAKGGAAVVTISEALPDYSGNSHSRMINLQNPDVLPGLTNAARAIQRHGALASIEFGHAGAFAGSAVDSLNSDVKARAVSEYVSSLRVEDIRKIVTAYGKAAALVKRAGFDMILIHSGHGWLLHQFLSPDTNHRTDEYGGSLQNRARLVLEILDAVRNAVGFGFPIELRMSAVEADPDGIALSQSIAFAQLVEDKVDVLHISAGGMADFYSTHPSMFSGSGVNVEYAAQIKQHVHIPVAVVGALNEPDEMEAVIAQGKADMVCMARALIADPDLPSKVMQNRDDEILRCLRCLVCHAERAMTQTRICALNPQIGREYEAKFEAPISTRKRVLVVGGGPGGMQCALTAARRGHDVTLCEKSGRLGGNLNCETNVPFKAAFPKYTKVMARQMEQAGVKVRLNTEVTPEFVGKFAPDALMIAIGADPLVLPLPGIDRENVILATDLDTREAEIGKRVVVLGGGLVGCESGLYLAQKGHDVTIVEMREDVAIDANIRHRPALVDLLGKYTKVLTRTKAKAITEKGLLCQREDGAEVLVEADTVLSASGLRPRTEQVNALRSTAPIVYAFGDCVKPGIIRGATFPAYHAALDLG